MQMSAALWNEEATLEATSPVIARLLDSLDGHERAAAIQRQLWFEGWFARKRARYLIVKRTLDVVLAALALMGCLPLLLLIACLIKLDDHGPVLYSRPLLSLHDQPFNMLKFRTMIPEAEAYLQTRPELLQEYTKSFKLRDDPRVTRIGHVLRRYSLDELPQLWNILRGEMSLVGPRCIPPSELQLFGDFAAQRHTIRPGLTGLWQVSGRSDTSYQQRIQLDRTYVQSCSLRRDLLILLRTVRVVLTGTGAY